MELRPDRNELKIQYEEVQKIKNAENFGLNIFIKRVPGKN